MVQIARLAGHGKGPARCYSWRTQHHSRSDPGSCRIMLDIAFAKPALPKSGALALLLGEGERPSGVWQQADEATGGAIERAFKAAEFKGAKGKTCTVLAPGAGLSRVVAVGLGKPPELNMRVLNEAGGH